MTDKHLIRLVSRIVTKWEDGCEDADSSMHSLADVLERAEIAQENKDIPWENSN